MTFRLCVFALTALPLLASAGECSQDALNEGRAKWAAAKVKSYRFILWEWADAASTFDRSPVRVTVSDGKVISSRFLHYASQRSTELEFDITELEAADIAERDTIPNLFTLIERHLEQTDLRQSCTLHPDLGFPLTFNYSHINRSHGAYRFSVSDFEVLE
ncbi:DUF6174 domain-containing protein [Steroidobacter cummioxidans]|uniref:DUF6174 domain-containing protein n=1 Tax=Steroidobacter cummioxidans TaxID=1803913 RepID=UPI00129078EE|nr:DUF6174 domain-containing protein [Steroidobacter cummioxidans]